MWGSLLRILVGFERMKQRGDRFFLDGDFGRARGQYERARKLLPELDYRIPTLDALIRECAVRTGTAILPPPSLPAVDITHDTSGRSASVDEGEPFVPDATDLRELAVAGKPPARAALYRGQGPEFDYGYVALVQGDAPVAVERLRWASRKAPGSFVVRLELGRALAMASEMNAARVELEQAVRLRPSDREAMSLLAAVHLQLGQHAEAEKILRPLIDRDGSEAESHFLLGQCLAAGGDTQAALEQFREAVRRDGTFHDAYFEAGRLLRGENDNRGALGLFVQACALLPDDVDYNRELATLVLERGLDVEPGLAACDRLMVTDEENRWEYLGWIAELYLRRGWKREAIDPLRKALEFVPAEKTQEALALRKRLTELEME